MFVCCSCSEELEVSFLLSFSLSSEEELALSLLEESFDAVSLSFVFVPNHLNNKEIKMDVTRQIELAHRYMKDFHKSDYSGHDVAHVERVTSLAQSLNASNKENI